MERIGKQNKKKENKMKTVYASDLNCLTPITIYQYSEHFEIFILEEFRNGKRFYYDFSKPLDIIEFKRKHKIEVDRIAFNDGSRAFHFYILGCLIAHSSTKSILPKCKISKDRRKLEVIFTEIELFDV